MKIYIIRPAKYEYKIKTKSLYDSYNHLATNDIKVSLEMDEVKLNHIQKVFGSAPDHIISGTLKRSSGTAELLQDFFGIQNKLKSYLYFNEIKYDMRQIITEKDFSALGVNATNKTRELFVEKLVNNQLTESFSEVVQRAEQAIAILSQLHTNYVVVISNSFFMKVLEYLILYEYNYHLITGDNFVKFYNGKSKAYDFLDGFSFRLEKDIMEDKDE